MTEVNEAVLREWCERLETTTTPQTTGVLNRVAEGDYPGSSTVGMCCLGVLTDMVKDRVGLEEAEIKSRPGVIGYRIPGQSYAEEALCPRPVLELIGTGGITPRVEFRGESVSVVQLNDQYGLSFKEIAALVREAYDL